MRATPSTLDLLLLLLAAAAAAGAGAQPADPEYQPPESAKVSFGPSVAIVIAVFASILCLVVLLLVYLKRRRIRSQSLPGLTPAAGGGGGVDRAVVESLPCFRFSSLRGARDGLECAVCLSRFAGEEVLRLLPKCKHAFHVGCVDIWLESSASCPLCRCRVSAGDAGAGAASGIAYSASSRFLFASRRHEASGERELELFVEREPAPGDQFLDRFTHNIIVSDAVFKGRWSALNSSDLLSLDLESGPERKGSEGKRRVEIEVNGIELAGSRGSNCSGMYRSMSEITNVSRSRKQSESDEKLTRIWWPIARRTVQCFAGRDGRPSDATETAPIV